MSAFGFYFPPESGEKVSLEVAIIMALLFFMNLVIHMMHPSSDIPILSTYFTLNIVMVTSSVVSG